MSTDNGYRQPTVTGTTANVTLVTMLAWVDGRPVRVSAIIHSEMGTRADRRAREKVLAELISHWESL